MHAYSTFTKDGWSGAGKPFQTWNPARADRAVGEYRATDPSLIPELIARARLAQRKWSGLTEFARHHALSAWVDVLDGRVDELAHAITIEQGKPLGEARGEVRKALEEFRRMLMFAVQPQGGMQASLRPGVRNFTLRRPRGVIVGITPWNFPILTPLRKIAPALAFGNAIILKPSELTPAALCLIAETAPGHLPESLLQIVLGDAVLGRALVEAQGIDGITFTGSVPTGRGIYRSAAANLAELSLELGGKNAALIHDTDDLDACLDQITGAAFACSGQRCTAISRVIVREELAASVVEGLTKRAAAIVLGDGLAPETTMGPLISAAHRDKVERMVNEGLASGSVAVTGGRRLSAEGLMNGHFFQPTILTGMAADDPVAREEIFGPVISVLVCRDLDQGMAMLNAVDFGLTSVLFSNDERIIQRFVNESANGMIHVNHGSTPDSHMPFGGIKDSGVGTCSVGASAVTFYTTEHAVYLQFRH